MALRAQFQMLILALHLPLHISSTPDFNFVQVLVQDLILQNLLKETTPLEDVRGYYIQCIYIQKEYVKFFLTGLFLFHILSHI